MVSKSPPSSDDSSNADVYFDQVGTIAKRTHRLRSQFRDGPLPQKRDRPRSSVWANQKASEADTQNEKPSKTMVSEGFRGLVISRPIGPAGLETLPETLGNTQSSPDVVLRVVLSELQKLSPDDRRQVVSQLQTLTGLPASPPSQPSPPRE